MQAEGLRYMGTLEAYRTWARFLGPLYMSHYLFTSESVGIGHPDKIADQISDGILDACLRGDTDSKVACEVLVTTGLVILAGEISSMAEVDYAAVARQVIHEIGYTDPALGFDYRSCGIINILNKQSPDIAMGVNGKEQGAGDQGIMFGYATDETPELMPFPLMLAHKIVRELKELRCTQKIPYLRPDAKAQVTVEYDEQKRPVRIHTVVISTQHGEQVSQEQITQDMKQLVLKMAPPGFVDDKTLYYINPTGRFVIGGPHGDTGLTGRKTVVDTYGGMGHDGGGAFSGKDPSKVDRSGAYAARYVAKNIVAAKLAKRCEVQISYAIGVPYPISIKVDTFGTGTVSEEKLAQTIPQVFNLTPKGMIEMLDLKKPIYQQTAFGGHFGRPEFPWEKTDKAAKLVDALKRF
jgi:S-adenosylmethionine synthetase